MGRYSSAPAKGKDDPYEMAGRYARHHQKSKRRKYAGAPEVAVQPPTGTEQPQGTCAPAFLKLLRQLVFEQVPQRPCRQAHPQARAENTPKGNPGSALQRPVPREPRAEIPRPASRQMAATRRRTPCRLWLRRVSSGSSRPGTARTFASRRLAVNRLRTSRLCLPRGVTTALLLLGRAIPLRATEAKASTALSPAA